MTELNEPRIEEILSDEDEDKLTQNPDTPKGDETHPVDDKPPSTEPFVGDQPPELAPVGGAQPKKQSRSEKKAKKAILKLGLKPVNDVFRVTIKKGNDLLFVISEPEVYRNSGDNTYVIFGEAKMDEFNRKDWEGMADEFIEGNDNKVEEAPELIDSEPNTTTTTTPPTEEPKITTEQAVDNMEFGVPSKYIDLVLEQVKVSREAAAEVLKTTNNDIVSSILKLEMATT